MKKKISIQDLSKKSNVAQSTIWKIINNKRDPKVSTVVKISKALGISIYELLEDEYSGSPKKCKNKKFQNNNKKRKGSKGKRKRKW